MGLAWRLVRIARMHTLCSYKMISCNIDIDYYGTEYTYHKHSMHNAQQTQVRSDILNWGRRNSGMVGRERPCSQALSRIERCWESGKNFEPANLHCKQAQPAAPKPPIPTPPPHPRLTYTTPLPHTALAANEVTSHTMLSRFAPRAAAAPRALRFAA